MVTRDEIRSLKKLMQEAKEMEKQIDTLKAQIMQEAEKEGISGKSWSDMSFRVQECKRTTLDKTALSKIIDLADYSHTTTYKRLTIG